MRTIHLHAFGMHSLAQVYMGVVLHAHHPLACILNAFLKEIKKKCIFLRRFLSLSVFCFMCVCVCVCVSLSFSRQAAS